MSLKVSDEKILKTLFTLSMGGVKSPTKKQVALMSGYTNWTGGTFTTTVKRLVKEKYLISNAPKGRMELHPKMIGSSLQDRIIGRSVSTKDDILDVVKQGLPSPKCQAMLDMLLQQQSRVCGRGGMERSELGKRLGYKSTSAGAFCTNSKILIDRGLVDYDKSTKIYSISEDIMPLYVKKEEETTTATTTTTATAARIVVTPEMNKKRCRDDDNKRESEVGGGGHAYKKVNTAEV